jgi:hypothetical protein
VSSVGLSTSWTMASIQGHGATGALPLEARSAGAVLTLELAPERHFFTPPFLLDVRMRSGVIRDSVIAARAGGRGHPRAEAKAPFPNGEWPSSTFAITGLGPRGVPARTNRGRRM